MKRLKLEIRTAILIEKDQAVALENTPAEHSIAKNRLKGKHLRTLLPQDLRDIASKVRRKRAANILGDNVSG